MKKDDLLTLRDTFAIQALCGMLAGGQRDMWNELAKKAYLLADAMLVERDKK